MVKIKDNDYHIEKRSRKRKYEETINEENSELKMKKNVIKQKLIIKDELFLNKLV